MAEGCILCVRPAPLLPGAPERVVFPDKPPHLSALGDPRGPLARMAAVGAVIVVLVVVLFAVAERNEGAGVVDSAPAGGGTEAAPSAGGLAPPGLWVDAASSGAEVFVDGARVGVVPLWLDSLPNGLRHVRVVDPEGRTLADTTISALAGDVIDLDFGGERRRRAEALAAAAPTDRSDAERPTPVARRPEPEAAAARPAAPASRPAAPAARPAAQAARRTEPRPAAPPVAPPAAARAPSTGELRVTSSPSGADVQLDGRFVGVTPLTIDGLRRGQYAIAVRAPGYEIVTQPVVIQGGGVFEAAVQLQLAEAAPSTESPRTRPAPAPSPRSAPSETGTLEVLVRPWGRIVIDGATHQRETDVVYRTVLSAGEHRVTASHPELGSVTRTVTVAPGETLRVEFDLARDGG